MEIDRIGTRSVAAKSAIGGVGIILIIALIAVFAYYNNVFCSSGYCPTNLSLATQVNTTGTLAQNGQYYLGPKWQVASGGGTPISVTKIAYPASNPSNYWNSGAMTAGTQYISGTNQFSLAGGGFCEQVYSAASTANSVVSVPVAQCITSPGTLSLPGDGVLPGFANAVNTGTCLVSSTSTPCILEAMTLPGTYDNGTSSVTAVTQSIVPGFAGTTIPASTFTMTYNLLGVSARGGGVGLDECADGTVLGGIPNQPVQQYTNGNGVILGAGQYIGSNCGFYLTTNQTNLSLNGVVVNGQTVTAQVAQINNAGCGVGTTAGINCWGIRVPASDIFTSSASSAPQYLFVSLTLSFTNNAITTGKHIFFVGGFVDNQQNFGYDIPRFFANSGITGQEVCSSSATTHGCVNSSDITVGTAQYTAGFPVAWGGGGSGSATKPSWFTPTSGVNLGWGNFAFVNCMATSTLVDST